MKPVGQLLSWIGSNARFDRLLGLPLLVESTSAGARPSRNRSRAFALHELGHNVDLLYSTGRIDARFSIGIAELLSSTRGNSVRTCVRSTCRHDLHLSDLYSAHQVRQSSCEKNGPFHMLSAYPQHKSRFCRSHCCSRPQLSYLYTPHGLVTNAPFRSRGYQFLAGRLERGLASRETPSLMCLRGRKRECSRTQVPWSKAIRRSEWHRFIRGGAISRASSDDA